MKKSSSQIQEYLLSKENNYIYYNLTFNGSIWALSSYNFFINFPEFWVHIVDLFLAHLSLFQ